MSNLRSSGAIEEPCCIGQQGSQFWHPVLLHMRDCASSAAVWVQDCTGSVAGYHHPKASKLPGRQVGAPQQPVGSAMERAEHA